MSSFLAVHNNPVQCSAVKLAGPWDLQLRTEKWYFGGVVYPWQNKFVFFCAILAALDWGRPKFPENRPIWVPRRCVKIRLDRFSYSQSKWEVIEPDLRMALFTRNWDETFYERQHILLSAYYLRQFHPSICLSHADIIPRRMKMGSCGLHCEVAKTLYSFLTPTMVGAGRRPVKAKHIFNFLVRLVSCAIK